MNSERAALCKSTTKRERATQQEGTEFSERTVVVESTEVV